jgi:hypothetical protein
MTDTTKAARQRKRRAALNAIAQGLGYASWARLETAVIRGQAVMTVPKKKKEEQ